MKELLQAIKEAYKEDSTMSVISDTEIEIHVRCEWVFLILSYSFFLFFITIALLNISQNIALVPSFLWLGIVFFFVRGSIYYEGLKSFFLGHIKLLATRHFLTIDHSNEKPILQFGYELWGKRFYCFQTSVDNLAIVSWSYGQGSHRLGWDCGDWGVTFCINTSACGEKKSQEVFCINEHDLSRKNCFKLGIAIVIFLQRNGAQLTQISENKWASIDCPSYKKTENNNDLDKEVICSEIMLFQEANGVFPLIINLVFFWAIVFSFSLGDQEVTKIFICMHLLFIEYPLSKGCVFKILVLFFLFAITYTNVLLILCTAAIYLFLVYCFALKYKEKSHTCLVKAFARKIILSIDNNAPQETILFHYKLWGNRYFYHAEQASNVVAIEQNRDNLYLKMCILDKEKATSNSEYPEKKLFFVLGKQKTSNVIAFLRNNGVNLVKKSSYCWQVTHRNHDITFIRDFQKTLG
ncbi:hypothetical protein [Candidatus Uabimicrobium sp. HlEnr_7]|uniref:hypothetical protein n=1 Tax=Candidatus Uabimicrobium helgolandensis TaxID=3095367 RepID=UPI003558CE27